MLEENAAADKIKTAYKKNQKLNTEKIDQNEISFFYRNQSEASKNKRKLLDLAPSPKQQPSSDPSDLSAFPSPLNINSISCKSKVRRDSKNTFAETLISFYEKMDEPPNETSVNLLKVAPESKIQNLLIQKLALKPSFEILKCANIEHTSDLSSIVENIGIDLIVGIYCSPNKNFDSVVVKSQLKELGLPVIVVHKLYLFLQQMKDQLIIENYL